MYSTTRWNYIKPFILDDVKRDFNNDYNDLWKKGLLFIILTYAFLIIALIFACKSTDEPDYDMYYENTEEYFEQLELYGQYKNNAISFLYVMNFS